MHHQVLELGAIEGCGDLVVEALKVGGVQVRDVLALNPVRLRPKENAKNWLLLWVSKVLPDDGDDPRPIPVAVDGCIPPQATWQGAGLVAFVAAGDPVHEGSLLKRDQDVCLLGCLTTDQNGHAVVEPLPVVGVADADQLRLTDALHVLALHGAQHHPGEGSIPPEVLSNDGEVVVQAKAVAELCGIANVRTSTDGVHLGDEIDEDRQRFEGGLAEVVGHLHQLAFPTGIVRWLLVAGAD
mmetsp:Transcript_14554/g.25880  ORF Transcript_14554/g.25880 Transcript_14554/m.25880 type:complete len:240 (-) Transcript_14554:2715-3434(-)